MKSRQKTPIQALTIDEAKILLKGSRGSNLEIPIHIATLAGLRRGEVWGLLRCNLDFDMEEIEVARSYDGPTKSGLTRIVPMSSRLKPLLWDKFKKAHRGSPLIPHRFDPNPPLKALCKRLEIPVVTFHGLRHTFAGAALDQGRNIKEVSTTLGHSSVTTTLDIYWASLKKMNVELF